MSSGVNGGKIWLSGDLYANIDDSGNRVHPSSHDVLEIEVEGNILLAFDYAQIQLRSNAKGFLILGGLMLATAGYLLVVLRRKRR